MTNYTIPTLHVASAITGVALCEDMRISQMHEVSEKLLGRPVWTHELAHAPTQNAIREAGARLFPLMPTVDEARADYRAAAAKAVAAYGETVTFPEQHGERSSDPVTTLVEVLERPL